MKKLILINILVLLCCVFKAQNTTEQNTIYQLLKRAHQYRIGIVVEQNYKKSLTLFEQAEQAGSIKALHALGMMYQNGWGCKKDYTKAIEYYTKASEQGYASSYYNLGLMYKFGNGVDINFAMAHNYFKKSAELNCPNGIYGTGYTYYRGLGCQQSYTKAYAWFCKGVEINHPPCQYYAALCLRNGYGIKQDTALAKALLIKAMQKGYTPATCELQVQTAENSYTHTSSGLKSASNTTHTDSLSTYKPVSKANNTVEISGTWKGERITYDYSGKHIINKQPVSVNFTQNAYTIKGKWTEDDTTSTALQGTINHNQLLFTKGQILRTSRYKQHSVFSMQQGNFTAQRKDGKVILAGHINEIDTLYKEPRKPIYVVLSKVNESHQTPLSTDSTRLATTNIEVPKLIVLSEETNSKLETIPKTELQQISSNTNMLQKPKIYPNPFTQQFTLEYEVPKQGQIQINLYNMKGTKVKTLLNATMPQGKYQLNSGQSLTVGTYVLSILHNGTPIYQSQLIIKQP